MQSGNEQGGTLIAFPGCRVDSGEPIADRAGTAGQPEGPRPTKKRRKKKKKAGANAKGRSERAAVADDGRAPGSRRGVETLFRTAYDTHLSLHAMADNKARMMIQVNGLILSVLLAAGTALTGGPAEPPSASIAFFVAGAVSMFFAVIAARPQGRRRNPRTGRDDERGGGMLFFYEFSGMGPDEYVASMNELMREPTALYDTMSRNLHRMGERLERKYGFLRLSYGALAVGVVAAAAMWMDLPARWLT